MNFYKMLAVAGYMLSWFQRSAVDGKISADELSELISHVAAEFGFEVELPGGQK